MPLDVSSTGMPTIDATSEAGSFGAASTPGGGGHAVRTANGRGTSTHVIAARRLQAGDAFGPRYHILKLLGVGGMGAVYQAWDTELSMAVALKVIRPDYADRGGEDSERRFKRELVLARQVTHKNVIRIHDLGEVEGTKYISMPFIEGADLSRLLKERGPLAIPEALAIARQIAAGLAAAHEVGVVHRDLKPANILVGASQAGATARLEHGGVEALITDFGIAHSLSGPAETRIVGTLRYMAPEQARGVPVDHRADIYAFGLIVYEMLTGSPWPGQTAIASSMTQDDQSTASATVVTPGKVPDGIAKVLRRCLRAEREERYATAAELLADLELIDDAGHARPRPRFYTVPAWCPVVGGRSIARGTAIASLAFILVVPAVAGAVYYVSRGTAVPVAAARDPVSVVVADFDNRTGEASLNGIVEQTLGLALEGAPFITAMPRSEAHSLAQQVAPGAKVDLERARIIAQREGINIVLAGSIAGGRSGYTVTVNTVDPIPGTVLASYSARAADKLGLLNAIGEVASELRTALGDTTPESARIAERETFTAASLDAAAAYSEGQALFAAGKYAEAIPFYDKATAADPGFGRAYSSWAAAAYTLGRPADAEALYKKAFASIDRMTEREKYRLYGTYYLTVAQAYDRAIENYATLVELYPADQAGHANLAYAHFMMGNLPKTFEHARRALELYPSSLKQRNNYALYAMYAGEFATGAKEAQAVLDKDPKYFRAYIPKAIAAADDSTQAVADQYRAMGALGPQGASLAAIALADLALYEGRPAAAADILQPAIAIDEANKNAVAAAKKYIALAEAYQQLGRTADAITAARSAVMVSDTSAVRVAAARFYVSAGRDQDARELAGLLGARLDPHSRVYARIIDAELAMKAGQTAAAVDALRSAQQVADLWLVHYVLGRVYLAAGQHPVALAEFETCLKRRGEATAIFLDDVPSLRYLSALRDSLARARQGMGLPS